MQDIVREQKNFVLPTELFLHVTAACPLVCGNRKESHYWVLHCFRGSWSPDTLDNSVANYLNFWNIFKENNMANGLYFSSPSIVIVWHFVQASFRNLHTWQMQHAKNNNPQHNWNLLKPLENLYKFFLLIHDVIPWIVLLNCKVSASRPRERERLVSWCNTIAKIIFSCRVNQRITRASVNLSSQSRSRHFHVKFHPFLSEYFCIKKTIKTFSCHSHCILRAIQIERKHLGRR